jgi:putative toxin-antitoxin system antitoxin component (TIGR02293 family)
MGELIKRGQRTAGQSAIAISVHSSMRNKDSINRIVWLILGGKEFLPNEPSSSIEYIYASSKGIPKLSVINLAEMLNIPMKDIASLLNISYKTLGRLQRKDLLDPLESSLSIELANLTARGISVFEDVDKFNQWLKKENRALSSKKPFDLLNTPTGIKMVGQLLERIEEGVYT